MRLRIPMRLGLCCGAILAISACAPSLIPGTEVPDTTTNRELLKDIEQYRQAVERRDAKSVIAMVSPTYFDERGHPDDPTYHWNYNRLVQELPDKFAKVKDMRLSVTIRRVHVKEDRAKVSYLFTENYLAELPAGETPEHSSDLSQIEFVRSGTQWLITKGL